MKKNIQKNKEKKDFEENCLGKEQTDLEHLVSSNIISPITVSPTFSPGNITPPLTSNEPLHITKTTSADESKPLSSNSKIVIKYPEKNSQKKKKTLWKSNKGTVLCEIRFDEENSQNVLTLPNIQNASQSPIDDPYSVHTLYEDDLYDSDSEEEEEREKEQRRISDVFDDEKIKLEKRERKEREREEKEREKQELKQKQKIEKEEREKEKFELKQKQKQEKEREKIERERELQDKKKEKEKEKIEKKMAQVYLDDPDITLKKREKQERKLEKQEKKIEKQEQKIEKKEIKLERHLEKAGKGSYIIPLPASQYDPDDDFQGNWSFSFEGYTGQLFYTNEGILFWCSTEGTSPVFVCFKDISGIKRSDASRIKIESYDDRKFKFKTEKAQRDKIIESISASWLEYKQKVLSSIDLGFQTDYQSDSSETLKKWFELQKINQLGIPVKYYLKIDFTKHTILILKKGGGGSSSTKTFDHKTITHVEKSIKKQRQIRIRRKDDVKPILYTFLNAKQRELFYESMTYLIQVHMSNHNEVSDQNSSSNSGPLSSREINTEGKDQNALFRTHSSNLHEQIILSGIGRKEDLTVSGIIQPDIREKSNAQTEGRVLSPKVSAFRRVSRKSINLGILGKKGKEKMSKDLYQTFYTSPPNELEALASALSDFPSSLNQSPVFDPNTSPSNSLSVPLTGSSPIPSSSPPSPTPSFISSSATSSPPSIGNISTTPTYPRKDIQDHPKTPKEHVPPLRWVPMPAGDEPDIQATYAMKHEQSPIPSISNRKNRGGYGSDRSPEGFHEKPPRPLASSLPHEFHDSIGVNSFNTLLTPHSNSTSSIIVSSSPNITTTSSTSSPSSPKSPRVYQSSSSYISPNTQSNLRQRSNSITGIKKKEEGVSKSPPDQNYSSKFMSKVKKLKSKESGREKPKDRSHKGRPTSEDVENSVNLDDSQEYAKIDLSDSRSPLVNNIRSSSLTTRPTDTPIAVPPLPEVKSEPQLIPNKITPILQTETANECPENDSMVSNLIIEEPKEQETHSGDSPLIKLKKFPSNHTSPDRSPTNKSISGSPPGSLIKKLTNQPSSESQGGKSPLRHLSPRPTSRPSSPRSPRIEGSLSSPLPSPRTESLKSRIQDLTSKIPSISSEEKVRAYKPSEESYSHLSVTSLRASSPTRSPKGRRANTHTQRRTQDTNNLIIAGRSPRSNTFGRKNITDSFPNDLPEFGNQPTIIKQIFSRRDAEGEETGTERLRIFIGSWNMGNAPPPGIDILRKWIPRTFDLYAVGVQESDWRGTSEYDKGQGNNGFDWVDAMKEILGRGYRELKSVNLWSIRLIMFVRNEHWTKINNIEQGIKPTGVAGVGGNKGGAGTSPHSSLTVLLLFNRSFFLFKKAISFQIYDTSFCFMTSHLAAHQDRVKDRNMDHCEIIKAMSLGMKSIWITSQFDYLFWFGDLNYRLDLPRDEVLQLISQKKWSDLYESDQLRIERQAERAFVSFQEGELLFSPTYRYERNVFTSTQSNGIERVYAAKKLRIPSWCDRILWKLQCQAELEQLSYGCCDEIMTSDHSPVYSLFSVKVFQPYQPRPLVPKPKIVIHLSGLHGWGPEIELEGETEKREKNQTFFPTMFVRAPFLEGKPSTPLFYQTSHQYLLPQTTELLGHFTLTSIVSDLQYLKSKRLYLTVHVGDRLNSTLVGVGSIPLKDACDLQLLKVEVDLFDFLGRKQAVVYGAIQIFVTSPVGS